MAHFSKKRLAEIAKRRFEADLEKGKHEDAIENAFAFKELFPKNRLLKDVVNACVEEGKLLMMEGKTKLGEDFFRAAHQIDKDHKQASFFFRFIQGHDLGPGGYCPWCGSNRLWGRRGWLWRQCIPCKVTFNKPCPICKSPHLSWTWNEKEGEYGCDRCQNVATKEEADKRKHRPSPFWLMQKSVEKKKKN